MSRISNNSFAVNSSLEQKIDLATVSAGGIPITGTVNVDVVADSVGLASSVNQVTGNASLANIDSNTSGNAQESTLTLQSSTISNIDTKITQGSDAALSSAMQVLLYARDSGGGLDALQVNGSGELIVTTSGGGTTHSGSQANLMNAVSASNGTNSNVITTTSSNNVNLFGVTNGTGDVKVQQSADNSNWYDVGYSLFPDMNGNFNASFPNHPANYWRIQATETATITATLLHS